TAARCSSVVLAGSISIPSSRGASSTGSSPTGRSHRWPRLWAGSVETTRVRRPLAAAVSATAEATVVLPTPPLPPTNSTRRLAASPSSTSTPPAGSGPAPSGGASRAPGRTRRVAARSCSSWPGSAPRAPRRGRPSGTGRPPPGGPGRGCAGRGRGRTRAGPPRPGGTVPVPGPRRAGGRSPALPLLDLRDGDVLVRDRLLARPVHRRAGLEDDPQRGHEDDDVEYQQQPVLVVVEGAQLDDERVDRHHHDERHRDHDRCDVLPAPQQHHGDDRQGQPGQQLVRGAEQRPDEHAAGPVAAGL